MIHLYLAAVVLYASAPPGTAQPPPSTPASQTEVEGLKAEVQSLKDGKDGPLMKLAGPLVAAFSIVASALVSFLIFVWHSGKKERRHQAIAFLNEFMTSEYFVKARLVIQEYLLPTGSKYKLSLDGQGHLLNFANITLKLGAEANDQDREARYYIRAIPSFFWLVDQAHRKGHISKYETLFNFHYSWYWTFIIRFRIAGCQDNRLFACLPWMLNGPEFKEISDEYDKFVESLPYEAKGAWKLASIAVKVDPPKEANQNANPKRHHI